MPSFVKPNTSTYPNDLGFTVKLLQGIPACMKPALKYPKNRENNGL